MTDSKPSLAVHYHLAYTPYIHYNAWVLLGATITLAVLYSIATLNLSLTRTTLSLTILYALWWITSHTLRTAHHRELHTHYRT